MCDFTKMVGEEQGAGFRIGTGGVVTESQRTRVAAGLNKQANK